MSKTGQLIEIQEIYDYDVQIDRVLAILNSKNLIHCVLPPKIQTGYK